METYLEFDQHAVLLLLNQVGVPRFTWSPYKYVFPFKTWHPCETDLHMKRDCLRESIRKIWFWFEMHYTLYSSFKSVQYESLDRNILPQFALLSVFSDDHILCEYKGIKDTTKQEPFHPLWLSQYANTTGRHAWRRALENRNERGSFTWAHCEKGENSFYPDRTTSQGSLDQYDMPYT